MPILRAKPPWSGHLSAGDKYLLQGGFPGLWVGTGAAQKWLLHTCREKGGEGADMKMPAPTESPRGLTLV
jgi:hypothetical protein